MFKWLKNKCTNCLRAVAPANVKSHLSVLTLNHAPTSILSKLPTLETALIKNVITGPQAESRTLRIARPLVKRMIAKGRDADKQRLEQVFGRYTRHYPDLESFLFCSQLAKYTNKFQSSKKAVIARKNTIAGFLAKKSSDFLKSYVLKVSSNEPTNYKLKENIDTENIFLNLNFKRMDHRVFNIIVDQGLAHVYGGLFYRAVFDAVKSAALQIKDEIDDQNASNNKKQEASYAFASIFFNENLKHVFSNIFQKLKKYGVSENVIFSREYCRAFWSAARKDLGSYFTEALSGEISSERADAAAKIADCVYLYCKVAQKLMQNDLV